MEYKLIRSGRRTLSVEIADDAGTLVRAPWRCPKAEIEKFVASHAAWIEEHAERQKRRMEAYPEPDGEASEALKKLAKAELPVRAAYYGGIMGLSPDGIKITGARRRFGSCSSKNRICFSWRLMRYPREAVDYVVVHELAHIAEKNHGPDFYALVESVLPDYRERRKLLR